jgi:hypothetical protein
LKALRREDTTLVCGIRSCVEATFDRIRRHRHAMNLMRGLRD